MNSNASPTAGPPGRARHATNAPVAANQPTTQAHEGSGRVNQEALACVSLISGSEEGLAIFGMKATSLRSDARDSTWRKAIRTAICKG